MWNAIRTLHVTSAPITMASVYDEIGRRGALNDRSIKALPDGPPAFVAKLFSHGAKHMAVNGAWHAAKAVALEARRRDLALATRIAQLASDPAVEDAHAAVLMLVQQHAADQLAFSRPRATSWSPVDIATLDLEQRAQATILRRDDGHGLLYPGRVHAIVGEPESGKSWVALLAAAQEIHAGHRVAYVDFEDHPAAVVRRMMDLGVRRTDLVDRFAYIRPDMALTAETERELAAACDGATLAVIDGVTEAMTMHGLSLMDNEDIARYLALLPRRIADLGPAVAQVDHVVKSTDDRGRYAIGGQHKLAGIDGAQYKVIVVEPFGRGKRGTARVIIDKDREGGVRQHAAGIVAAELVLDSTPTGMDEVGPLRAYLNAPGAGPGNADGQDTVSEYMERLSLYVEDNPGIGSNVLIASVVGKSPRLREARKALVDGGYITAEKRGKDTQHHSIVPFRREGM